MSTVIAYTPQVSGSKCKLLENGECWCEGEPVSNCPCQTGGLSGCPGGGSVYGKHAGYELCGYEEGYSGTYFPATEAAAQAFGYYLSKSSSCATNTVRTRSRSITPLSCPKHQTHCKNGFCNWLTQQDAWNRKECGVQVCCTAFVRCINLETPETVKTTTESNYVVTTLPPMDPEIREKLPTASKKIYQGEYWKYFKVPIPAGNFNITGKVLADVCQHFGMKTPCPTCLRFYQQKLCIETSHSGLNTANFHSLQTAISEKGYDDDDFDHLQFTFCYSFLGAEEDGIDNACGYMPGYYCKSGKETISVGIYFALCAIPEEVKSKSKHKIDLCTLMCQINMHSRLFPAKSVS